MIFLLVLSVLIKIIPDGNFHATDIMRDLVDGVVCLLSGKRLTYKSFGGNYRFLFVEFSLATS